MKKRNAEKPTFMWTQNEQFKSLGIFKENSTIDTADLDSVLEMVENKNLYFLKEEVVIIPFDQWFLFPVYSWSIIWITIENHYSLPRDWRSCSASESVLEV